MFRQTAKNLIRQLLPPILLRAWGVINGRLGVRDLFDSTSVDGTLFWYCPLMGGWLTPENGNIRLMSQAIQAMPEGGSVVEIGSFMGQSTNILNYLSSKHRRNQPLYTCDPWIFDADPSAPGMEVFGRSGFSEFAQDAFKLNCRFFSRGQEPRTLALTSDQFFERWRESAELFDVFGRKQKLGGGISFAYIDGRHTGEAIRSDFENVDNWLLPGGYVLLDDTGYDTLYADCRNFALSLLKHPGYEVIRRHPNFLFRKNQSSDGPRP